MSELKAITAGAWRQQRRTEYGAGGYCEIYVSEVEPRLTCSKVMFQGARGPKFAYIAAGVNEGFERLEDAFFALRLQESYERLRVPVRSPVAA